MRAIGNLDVAMQHLNMVKEVYRPTHERIADMVEVAMGTLLRTQEFLERIKNEF